MFARHDSAANGGAFLTGLDRHFSHHFFDEQIKFFVIGCDVIGQDGAVQRVGFCIERNAVANQVGIDAQLGRRVC